MFVPLFYAKRSPNPIVKTALLQTTSTKSTSREWGDNDIKSWGLNKTKHRELLEQSSMQVFFETIIQKHCSEDEIWIIF